MKTNQIKNSIYFISLLFSTLLARQLLSFVFFSFFCFVKEEKIKDKR